MQAEINFQRNAVGNDKIAAIEADRNYFFEIEKKLKIEREEFRLQRAQVIKQ